MIPTLKDIDLPIIEAAGGANGGTVPEVAAAVADYNVLRAQIAGEHNEIEARRKHTVETAAERKPDDADDDVRLSDELDARELRAIRRELAEVPPCKQRLRDLCVEHFDTHAGNLKQDMDKRVAHIRKQAATLDVAPDPLIQADAKVQSIRDGLRHFEGVRRGLGTHLLDDDEKARIASLRQRAKEIMARRLGLVLPTPPRVKEVFIR